MQTTTQTAIVESIKNIDKSALPPIAIHISFEMLLATIETLPQHQQWQLYQTLGTKLAPISAEAKAISRLSDEDDSSKWITVMEVDEEVDEQALDAWLETEGYSQNNV
jgi:hypothetical protein